MGCACGQEPEDINPLPELAPANYWVPALIGLGILGIFWLTWGRKKARRNSTIFGRQRSHRMPARLHGWRKRRTRRARVRPRRRRRTMRARTGRYLTS